MSNELTLREALSARTYVSQFIANRLSNNAKYGVERDYALSVISQSKSLQRCTPDSVARCIIDMGVMGVSLSPTLKQAYLIPYGDTCTVSISYMGMEQLAYRTGTVVNIQCNIARQGDEINVFTKDNKRQIEHKEAMSNRGKVTHAYCIATFENGLTHIETMDREDLMGVRDAAAKKNKGQIPFTWKGAFRYEMYKKAVLRRAWKHWPKMENKHAEKIRAILERQDPVDFTPVVPIDERPGESTLTVTDTMIEELNDMMGKAGVMPEKFDRWLLGLSKSMGYQSTEAMKVEDFDKAKEKLENGLASWIERTQGDSNETTD